MFIQTKNMTKMLNAELFTILAKLQINILSMHCCKVKSPTPIA